MPRVPAALVFLLVAWFFANRPQAGFEAVVHWLGSAGTLSHQESMLGDLRMKLAEAGTDAERVPCVAGIPDETPSNPPGPVPPGAGGSRLDLALTQDSAMVPPLASRWGFWDVGWAWQMDFAEPAAPVPRRYLV